MPTIPHFLPSTHGLQFPNWWPPGTPDLLVSTPVGEIRIGDASQGLCGGFCFLTADLYRAGRQPPTDTAPPSGGSALVRLLTWRLLASWNLPGGALTYYYWANTPDHDTLWGARPGVVRMTVADQIPRIVRSVDQGQPCTLGLVTLRSGDPRRLAECHQVLCFGYSWSGSVFRAQVYDPNSPGEDEIFLRVDTSAVERLAPVEHNVGIAHPVRGFFVVNYAFRDPGAVAGAPWPVVETSDPKLP